MCNCFPSERFAFETLDLLALSDRDSSLADAGMALGAIYAANRYEPLIDSLKSEIKDLDELRQMNEITIYLLRGVSPGRWAKNESR
jgi:hypothetical protein